ncbi:MULTISPECIES: ATP-binding protein [Gordonia]|uniref:ATP-binding protein n=1 Tax=Gordonia TaxID=2053 RepID=UPI00257DEB54|nr:MULTISPECIES: ATP-binding protein [Gordonia]
MTVDTSELVRTLRALGTDLTSVEVKAAVGGLPKSTVETLSAFANGDGGTLMLGLDEQSGFRPAEGFRATAIRDALANACSDGVTPSLRVAVEMEEFEGASIIRVEIPELDPVDKPCFVTARGEYQGSFIRSGDGDVRLSHYEVTQLLSNRSQPTFDAEVVTGASMDDLDPALVDALISRSTRRSPRTFASLDRDSALLRLGAAVRDDDTIRPSLAGLLCLGTYPQQFFPQLFVSFVVLPGLTMGDSLADGTRFLDNVNLDGPIPHIVADATSALLRNMRSASVIRGIGREDRYDYPLEVFRELLVNALMHRDYSPQARGTQIQVELYPDRMVIKSPGGLFGAARADDLGTADQISSSRNATLARLLADVELPDEPGHVVSENRGSGLPRVVSSLRQAGMSPPAFDVPPGRVTVTVPQHALLSVDIIDWIASLGAPDLTDAQKLALAIMRSTGRVTNAMLQAWGIDRIAAGNALRDLVTAGLATVSGGKRYASYRLAPQAVAGTARADAPQPSPTPATTGIAADFDAIKQAIRAGHVSARQIGAVLDMDYHAVLRRLRVLVAANEVERTKAKHSRSQTYRLTNEDT